MKKRKKEKRGGKGKKGEKRGKKKEKKACTKINGLVAIQTTQINKINIQKDPNNSYVCCLNKFYTKIIILITTK